jgi:hypothetical protein
MPTTERPDQTTKTAPSPNPTTGRVPNNAPNPGSAEELECAREVDGAQDTMDVKELHSQTRPQDSPTTTEMDQKAVVR